MSKPFSFGKLAVGTVASLEEAGAAPEPDTPFRVAILGDFSARTHRGVLDPGSLVDRRPLAVDRDNFEEVMARLNVELHLPIAGSGSPPVTIRFRELDDFHPDRIYGQVEAFGRLRALRRRLNDPRTFAAAAAEVRLGQEKAPPEQRGKPAAASQTPTPEPSVAVPEGLFDRMLEQAEAQAPPPAPLFDRSQWESFLAEIVRPYSVAKADPQQPELVASVDAAAAELMRAILHHPDFQAIEAAWRAVFFLVSRLETDTQLKLYLLDVSKEELHADLEAAEDLQATGIYKLLVEKTVHTLGGQPWALLAGNYTLDQTRKDAEMLGRMAKIASRAGAPFVAAASPRLLGCESLAATPDPDDWQLASSPEDGEAWQSLRKLPDSSYLGLALPRFLLRLPYGPDTTGTEQFALEEMPGAPSHEAYLWGNPGFACVYLLGQAFSRDGWRFRPGVIADIDGLPVHIYKAEGESLMKPCAEALLGDRAVEAILDKGLMPLVSFQNQGAVRLAGFRSLADPPKRLMGRWA